MLLILFSLFSCVFSQEVYTNYVYISMLMRRTLVCPSCFFLLHSCPIDVNFFYKQYTYS